MPISTWTVATAPGPGVDFTSIQGAIDAAGPGDTILVGAGVYQESLSITEGISIEAEPGAILQGPLLTQLGVPVGTALNDFFEQNHPAYSQSTGVEVSADDVSISGLTITGFANGLVLNTSDGVTLAGNTFIDNVNGIRKGEAQQVTDLTVNGNTFTQGIFGMTVYAASSGAGSFDGITMNNNSFSELSEKGMYFEQLSNASLTGNEFDDVGNYGRVAPPFGAAAQDGEFGQAIDINLKYETYSNVTFTDTEITNSGHSDRDGAGSPGVFGAAIGVKTRDDAPSYNTIPASFTGEITFDGLTIDGTSTGVRIGEPGKNNLGPDVLLQDVTIANATITDVNNATHASAGGATTVELSDTQVDFDGSQSQADLDVTGNDLGNTITTGDGDDTLTGGDGNDTLTGGEGADAMAGGDDDDTYHIDGSDTITELAGEGTDTVVASDSTVLQDNFENLTLVDGPSITQTFDDMGLGPISNTENGWNDFGPPDDQAIVDISGNQVWKISSDPASGDFGGPYSPPLDETAGEPSTTADYSVQFITFDFKAVSSTPDNSRLEVDFGRADGTDRNNFMVIESIAGQGIRVAVNEPLPDGNFTTNDFAAFTGNVTLTDGVDASAWHQIKLRLVYNDGADNDVIQVYLDGQFIGETTTFENYRDALGGTHAGNAEANQTSRVLFRGGVAGQPNDGPGGDNQGFYFDDVSYGVYNNASGTGNAAANVIKGNSGDNVLSGLGGADTLHGNAGDDTLEGGADTDTAVFAATLDAGDFSFVAGKWVVTAAGIEGEDTLNDVEKVTDGGGNTFLLVGGNGYASVAAAEADQTPGDIILVPSTPVINATVPVDLVEATSSAPGTASATAVITRSDALGAANYDFAALVGWNNEGGGIFTKAGTLGTATLDTNANTLTFALDNAAADSLSAADHPTEQFEIPVINGFGAKDTTTVTFTIDGANDAPTPLTDANAAANRVDEDAPNNALVGVTARSTDAEGDTLTYVLTDNADGRFKINATTGVVTVLDRTKLDFETATSHTITVRVTDGNGGEVLRNFTINILDAEGNTINGTGGSDTINGTDGPPGLGPDGVATPENDTIFGGDGNDRISSLAGKDVVNGGNGNDTVNGGDHADRLNGAAGVDTASYAGSDAGVTVNLSLTTAQSGGDAQGDRLSGFENVLGTQFADRLTGDAANNVLRGAGGDDDLRGAGGNDNLQGGNGDDDLRGGNGNDRLFGGTGNDDLRGNAGSDTFFFATGYDADTVHDYVAGADEFNLRGTSVVTYNQLKLLMTNVAGDVEINFGGGDVLTILNTTRAILNQNAEDFHF